MSVEEKNQSQIEKKIKKNFFFVYYQMTLHQYNAAYVLEIWFVNKATLYFHSYVRFLSLTKKFFPKKTTEVIFKTTFWTFYYPD